MRYSEYYFIVRSRGNIQSFIQAFHVKLIGYMVNNCIFHISKAQNCAFKRNRNVHASIFLYYFIANFQRNYVSTYILFFYIAMFLFYLLQIKYQNIHNLKTFLIKENFNTNKSTCICSSFR